MEATKAQLEFIKEIEEFVGVRFEGTSKKDATAYISKHIDDYKRLSANQFVIVNGYD